MTAAGAAVGLLGLDFDGTLLRTDGTVSDRTKRALRAAADHGWLVVGATGRPPALAEIVTRLLDGHLTHLITNNGSLTTDAAGDIISQIVCTAHDARWAGEQVRSAVRDAGLAVDHVDGDQTWEDGLASRVPNPPIGEMVDDALATITGDVRKLLAYSDAHTLDELFDRLHPILIERLEVTHSGLPFLEIGPPGVSKASALAAVAQRHDVSLEQTVVFGDARNDHEMLRWAGVGVAMANADAETQTIADVVTGTNDEDGVASYIERLLA